MVVGADRGARRWKRQNCTIGINTGEKEVVGENVGCEPGILRGCQCPIHCTYVGSVLKQAAYGKSPAHCRKAESTVVVLSVQSYFPGPNY